MWGSKLCVMLTVTDDAVMSVTANLVSGQLCRPAAKFGSEKESYKSLVTDTLSPCTHTYTKKINSERSHLPHLLRTRHSHPI